MVYNNFMKVQFPKPTGQYAVGTFTYTIKDHRKEVLPADGMRSIAARVYLKHAQSVYKVLFKDMKHIGFADSKYTMPIKSVVGRLEPDLMHENLCKCHLEFFDAYLKKTKPAPNLADNDVIKVKEYSPDL